MWDCIIIGAGVCGCAVARELSAFSGEILLLEAESEICAGASRASTSIVHAGYDARPGSFKSIFGRMGNVLYDRLSVELGVPFARNGSLVVAFDEQELEQLRRLQLQGEGSGVEGLSLLGREALREREPHLPEGVLGALYAENAGVTNAHALTLALWRGARQNGVELERSARVTDIRRRHSGYVLYSEQASYAARVVVNAAGLFADEVTRMVREDVGYAIQPRKGEYIVLGKERGGYFHSTIFQAPHRLPGGGHTKGVALIPSVDGTLMIGPTVHDAADKWDLAVNAHGVSRLFQDIARLWPDVPVEAVEGTYAGLRAHSTSDDFVIGEVPGASGFFQIAGIESPGLTAAPAIGKYVASLVREYLGLS